MGTTSKEVIKREQEPKAESAGATVSSVNTANKALLTPKLDFGDLKPMWDRLRLSRRDDAESHLLKVHVRNARIDTLAEQALKMVKEQFSADIDSLRSLITQQGWATELDRVIKRINATRLTDAKRLVLAAVYPAILQQLLSADSAEEEVKDEMGFTEAVFFEFERASGPLDVFAQSLVQLVGEKHRVSFSEDNVLRDLVAHQVRNGL